MRAGSAIFLVVLAVGCGADELDDADLVVTPGDAAQDADKTDRAAGGPRVELKLTIDPAATARARSRLRLHDATSEVRRIWFYDTPGLDLLEAGAILRARDVEGGEDDSTVKLRPLDAAAVDASWLAVDGFKCEIDRVPGRSVSSCSLSVDQDEGEIAEVGAGERPIDKLFSGEQEDLFAAHGPRVDWAALVALGPVPARVWKIETAALPEKLTAELWSLPDGAEVLELSMKVDAPDADAAQVALLEWIVRRGLPLAGDQESKTRRALELLAAGAAY
jgi:hypothetical protein